MMNRHIQHECQGAKTRRDEIRELKLRKDKGEVCWKKNCPKVLVVKIKCDVSLARLHATRRRADQLALRLVLQTFILSNTSTSERPSLYSSLDIHNTSAIEQAIGSVFIPQVLAQKQPLKILDANGNAQYIIQRTSLSAYTKRESS